MHPSRPARTTPPLHLALRLWPAAGGKGRLAGELEHVYSGECHAFDSGDGLLALLQALQQVSAGDPQGGGSKTPMAPSVARTDADDTA